MVNLNCLTSRVLDMSRHAEIIFVVISLKYPLKFLRTLTILICMCDILYNKIKDIENIAPRAFYRKVFFL